MNHSVQQSLLQLQLRGEIKPTRCQLRAPTVTTLLLKSEIRTMRGTQAHLLHDVQLRVLRLKKLDEQLEDLRVQQLVTRTDLCGGSVYVYSTYRSLTEGKGQV